MSSILTNASALSALQALTQTQAALTTTENQVSTGLAVSSAADNASYWSIATQLNSNSDVVTASNQALAQSQAVMSTASSAINSVITAINSIESALTQAATPGASINNINTTLASLGSQLSDAVNGASFNGLNILNGSQTAALNFVAGFNATASGGSFNTISFTAQAMTGGTSTTSTVSGAAAATAVTLGEGTVGGVKLTAGGAEILTGVIGGNGTAASATGFTTIQQAANGAVTTKTYTAETAAGAAATLGTASVQFSVSAVTTGAYSAATQEANITNSSQVAELNGLTDNSATTTVGVGQNVVTKNAGSIVVQSLAADGSLTNTTYSALDANGAATTLANAVQFGVSAQSTTATGMLVQNGFDLTNLTTSGATAASQLSAVQNALSAVTTYAATIGATQDRMTAASTFNSALTTNYATGVSALVDADMNTASTRLQALQTQEQLGIQSLSIANQNAQLILKLFP
jgi:flagellin